jgi:hypothetical protein
MLYFTRIDFAVLVRPENKLEEVTP